MKDLLLDRLSQFGQQHLLSHWDRLNEHERRQLAAQIESIDLAELDRLVRHLESEQDWSKLSAKASGPPAFRLNGQGNRFGRSQAVRAGTDVLRAGKLGILVVAGGQATRLGFDHPKGMYPIGPVSEACLFQILLEKVVALGRRHGVAIPVYLMTSPATHEETIEFLSRHERFGLPAESFHIFCQGTMPAVDKETGKILLAEPGQLALSPDGHGGMISALRRSGLLADMRQRGIEQLFYMQVDNPLVVVGDAEFIGYHLLSQSEMSTQVVVKHGPTDKMGNVVLIDGQVRIIEYSDLPEEDANRRNPDGSLVLWAGNTAVHVFDLAFLERMSVDSLLPFHLAHKAVSYVADDGRMVEPNRPNAIKFERFIFDLLPAAKGAIVVEVDEKATFAPLKNAPGAAKDSPEAVKRQMMDLHRSWLERCGSRVPANVAVEISPLFALDADELAERIKPGTQVDRPTYFH